jgi:hypothetical protein
MATGSWIIGSLATSSSRYPGGSTMVFIESAGESTGDSAGIGWSGGGHDCPL